ncbi:MAG: hypothetical protein UW18_C0003G0218 [Microgenomates group bacterium GW2011_GWF1_44_10]|nr:MAG: hypothetical protein UW18_C0003G0218 [Microgenomates group bacterium GW2011_GWF1_44_10]
MSTNSTPIIILHGWTYSIDRWQPFVTLLQKSGFSVELLRIPGLTAPLAEDWNLSHFEDWLKTELESRGINNTHPCILLGHSFGGHLSARFTAQHASYVRHLFLLDCSGIRPRSIKLKIKRMVFFLLSKLGAPLKMFHFTQQLAHKLAREKDYHLASPRMKKIMHTIINADMSSTIQQISTPFQES